MCKTFRDLNIPNELVDSILVLNAFPPFEIVVKANGDRRKSIRPSVSGESGGHTEETAVVRIVIQIIDERDEDNQPTFIRITTDIQ